MHKSEVARTPSCCAMLFAAIVEGTEIARLVAQVVLLAPSPSETVPNTPHIPQMLVVLLAVERPLRQCAPVR